MPAIGQLIHSFNPKPFKNIDVATYALLHKDIAPGEIAIAYYNDIDETVGVGSIIATGNVLPGGNQIFKNANYTDKVVDIVKQMTEQNSKDLKVIEQNVNNSIADIAIIKNLLGNFEEDNERTNSEIEKLKSELNELINTLKTEVSDINDAIDEKINESLSTLNDKIESADTSIVSYVDAKFNTIDSDIQTLNTKVTELESNLEDTLESDINDLTDLVNNVSNGIIDKIEKLDLKVTANDTAVKELITDLRVDFEARVDGALETGNAYTDNEIAHLDKKFEDVSDNIMWVINDTSKHTMSTIDKLDHEINDLVYDTSRDIHKEINSVKDTLSDNIETAFGEVKDYVDNTSDAIVQFVYDTSDSIRDFVNEGEIQLTKYIND